MVFEIICNPYDCNNLMQGFIGAILGAIVSVIGVWFLTRMQIYEEKKLDLARKRLEKLYGPLMLQLKVTEKISGKKDTMQGTTKQLDRVSNTIAEGFYLANVDMIDDLVELYDHLFYQQKDEKFGERIVAKIKKKYEETKRIAGVD